MAKTKRSWDILTSEKRRESVQDLIDFFLTERDEEIGVIAAENLLDHFLQNVGKQIYNKGIEDSIVFLKERLDSLEIDMETLIRE